MKDLLMSALAYLFDSDARELSPFTYANGNAMSIREAKQNGLYVHGEPLTKVDLDRLNEQKTGPLYLLSDSAPKPKLKKTLGVQIYLLLNGRQKAFGISYTTTGKAFRSTNKLEAYRGIVAVGHSSARPLVELVSEIEEACSGETLVAISPRWQP